MAKLPPNAFSVIRQNAATVAAIATMWPSAPKRLSPEANDLLERAYETLARYHDKTAWFAALRPINERSSRTLKHLIGELVIQTPATQEHSAHLKQVAAMLIGLVESLEDEIALTVNDDTARLHELTRPA